MRVDDLERELRAERAEPGREFAARLDEWAAEGFPRDRGLGPRVGDARARGGARGLWERLSAIPPRRLLAPVGAAAAVLVVAAVVVGRAGEIDGGAETVGEGSAATEPGTLEGAARAADEAVVAPAPIPPTGGDGIAAGTEERIVDASARIVLGAEADEVQQVANEVVEVADRHRGIVLESQVTRDAAGARATFEVEIPYRELDAAIADLSGLADVISRSEATEDITARAVRAEEELARTLERLRAARIELLEADTRRERLVIRSEIASLEATADALETEVARVERQGRFATVEVAVESAESGEGGWTLGDAVDDAGRVLEVIAGVALVSLAILVPLALVAALAGLLAVRARDRRRERALES